MSDPDRSPLPPTWRCSPTCAPTPTPEETPISNQTPDLYRKKPVTVTAVQWTGVNLGEVSRFLGEDFIGVTDDGSQQLLIGTLEDGAQGQAKHVADLDDWIIRGVAGEYSTCRDDIFELTHEPAPNAHLAGWAGDR